MSFSDLIRWGALAAVVSGVLLFIVSVWDLFLLGLGGPESLSEIARTNSWIVLSVLGLLTSVLALFALVGLHLYHADAAGLLGFVGFVVAFLGTALLVGTHWAFAFVAPSLAVEAPEVLDAEQVAGPLNPALLISFIALAVGWALFGLAALRARVYPRWLAIALIVVALAQVAPLPTGIVFAPVLALLGLVALSGRGASADGQPSRVR